MIEKPSQYLEDEEPADKDEPVEVLPYTPETADETARKTGLALSAGIVFFASVVVMLFIGWLLDRYFGTSPRYLTVGIILGAVIGFYQLFRLTSQIIRKK